jgi:transcriptional regulator NrdR family protein
MIACPKCTSTKSRVRELKSKPGFNRRYRICVDCGHSFVTHEHIVVYEGKLKGMVTVPGPLEAGE